MAARGGAGRAARRVRHDLPFVPRVVNPVRVEEVILLAAAEDIRAALRVVETEMPWVRARVCSNPLAVSTARIDRPTVLMVDDTALNLLDVDRIRRNGGKLVVVLLSAHPLVQSSPPAVARTTCPYSAKADLVFAVNATQWPPDRIVGAAVRAGEDHLNIAGHPEVRRFIFLVVDDEPRWFSQFLPVLYAIIGQRAAVKLARTYEEAVSFLFGVDNESDIRPPLSGRGHGDDVVCLVTDIYFPKSDVVTSDAGRDLVGLVKRHHPRIPVIIASKTEEASALERSGLVLPKGDPGFLNLLRDYIRDRTGMADFVIYDETGEEWYRLKDLRDIEQLLARAGRHDSEAERLRRVLTAYGEQDRFSSWFYMHGLRRLADRLRPERLAGEQLVAVLKQQLARERGRMRRMPLVLDGNRILDLPALLAAVRAARHEEIQAAADRDDISCWLDQQGYCELAEELRPVHGRGAEFRRALAGVVEKWITIYDRRAVPRSG